MAIFLCRDSSDKRVNNKNLSLMRLLVTGANGFIGRALCGRLSECGHEVVAAVRADTQTDLNVMRQVAVGSVDSTTDWRTALEGCRAVVHLAGYAHHDENNAVTLREAFWQTNVAGTGRLLRQAIESGIETCVFMSSCKAIGERSPLSLAGTPLALSHVSTTLPEGPYGQSKLAAERLLTQGCTDAGISLTILRPPLVYGPGVKGNIATLLGAIWRGLPLPLGSIRNLRSFIHRENLIEAVLAALVADIRGVRTYTLADCTFSTPELVRRLASGLGKRARIYRCPVPILKGLGHLSGKAPAVVRLTESLVLDSTEITADLNWRPSLKLDAAWHEVGEIYLQQHA